MNAESPGTAYRLFSLLLLPVWLLHAFLHGQSQGLANYLKLRFFDFRASSKKNKIWVHASSVGEVTAISPLVENLIAEGQIILFTSFTASGLQTIRRQFPDGIESTVIPIDVLPCCWLFFHQHQIKLCLLMETELWPELLYQAARRRIPVIQVNARLSEKSTQAPIFIRYLLRRTIANIDLHLTRNENDRRMLTDLGAEPERIKIIGNLKSGIAAPEVYEDLIGQDYLLLASSHEGEEALFLQHRRETNPLIVIAPRHPKRSQLVQSFLSEAGIRYAVRSKEEPIESNTQVYLADTLGELKTFMAHARLVIMGGSFDQTGGHNLIEPASLGCAIITGSSDSNIAADIRQLGDSIIQVGDMPACWQKIGYLLDNPEAARRMGEKARDVVRQQGDILTNYLEEIRPYYQPKNLATRLITIH